jgi:hypothetical protein
VFKLPNEKGRLLGGPPPSRNNSLLNYEIRRKSAPHRVVQCPFPLLQARSERHQSAHYEECNVSCPGTFYYILARCFAGFVRANSHKRHSSPAISLSGRVVMNSSPHRQLRISLRASLWGAVRPTPLVELSSSLSR